MYIEPNTIIKIYSGIPLDNTYTNTLYFGSLVQQQQFFSTTTNLKYTIANNSYQRVERGRMRIEKKADELYDCNYIAFQNTNYGNKWFYAFITGVEFVNNVTSEITFEIDTIQTYMFDIDVKDCYVEREHSVTDAIGDNIQAEKIAIGEYIESDYGKVGGANSMLDRHVVLVMVTADSVQGGTSSGGGQPTPQNSNGYDVALYDNIRCGTLIYAFKLSDTEGITTLVKQTYQQAPENIIMMYIAPSYVLPQEPPLNGELIYGSFQGGGGQFFNLPTLNGTESFNGYVPKNKKLYTYPYNFMNVSDGGRNNLPLRYEFFEKNVNGSITPKIRIDTSILPPVKLVLRPANYKGMTNNNVSKTEALTIDGFPLCSWNNDYYKTWLSQNLVPQILKSGVAIATGTIAIASGVVAGGIMSMVGTATDLLSQHYEASIHADVTRGNTYNGNVDYSNDLLVPWYSRFHINSEQAKVIDNFFNMFGYACNQVKTPSFNNRPHWTYVKTNGCNAVGKAPADEIKRFCSIIDKGITFWKYASDVGNYALDNSPVI